MKNYSIAELREFGFDDEQIAAINRVKVQNAVAKRKEAQVSKNPVVLDFDDDVKVEKPAKATSIKKSIKKYTEAMKLVKECDDELKQVEEKVNKIVSENGELKSFEVE